MAISAATLLAHSKTWSARVMINDVSYDPSTLGLDSQYNIILPTRTVGLDQRGSCTLAMRFQLSEEDAPKAAPAQVWMVINGEETLFFTGIVAERPQNDLPLAYDLTLVDAQYRLAVPLAESLVWSGAAWPDVVRDLLHRAGITDAEIASIYDPGSVFALGPVYPIEIDQGQTIQQVLASVLTYAGCGLFVGADGRFTVRDDPGWPDATATLVYAFGADKSQGELGFENSRRTIGGAEGDVRQFTAVGPRRPDGAIPDATFTLAGGIVGRSETQQYQFLQTDDAATRIAEIQIVRRNLTSVMVDVSGPLNPNLQPGDSIQFRNPDLGFFENTPARIASIRTDGDGMHMSIAVGAGPAEGDISLIPPPDPDFAMLFEQQPLRLAGAIRGATVVQVQDRSSDPSGFEIVSVAYEATCAGTVEPETAGWSMPAPDAEPQPTNTRNPIFIFSTLEGATITQVVESASGEGNTTTKAVVPTEADAFTRVITVAAGLGDEIGTWKLLAGSSGWRGHQSADACTAVPNMNDVGPMLAGFASGELLKTENFLATSPVPVATFTGSIACIFVNEGNPQHILVGAGMTLHRTTDGGITWTTVHEFSGIVAYCESSPANPNEIRVCAGQHLYISFDGVGFAIALSGPDGSSCMKVASAGWGHLAVWLGTMTIDDAWQFEEGHGIDWSGVPEPPMDLSSVTALQYREGFLVIAGGQDIVRDGLFGELSYVATTAPGVRIFVLEGGGGFTAHEITTTTESGPLKLVNHHATFAIDTVTEAYRIGYGQATAPPLPPQLVVVPHGVSGAGDRLWHYAPAIGWTPKDLPLVGAGWWGIDINPNNPLEWVIWTETRMYWSNTAGDMWAEIYAPTSGNVLDGRVTNQGVRFTGLGSTWIFSRYVERWYGTGRFYQSHLAAGEGATPIHELFGGHSMFASIGGIGGDGTPYQLITSLVRGLHGELVGHATEPMEQPTTGKRLITIYQVTIDPALQTYIVGETLYAPMAPWRGDGVGAGQLPGLLSIWSTNVAWSPNYRSSLPINPIAAGTSVAWCETGVFVGGRTGIAQIHDSATAPTMSIVAAGDLPIGQMVSGSRYRSVAAHSAQRIAGAGDTEADAFLVFAWNGTQWSATPAPSDVTRIGALGVVEP